MRSIVVYQSNTGFTAQYAQWIAEALHCECTPLKKASREMLAGYDRVIFGGWVMGNGIAGLNRLRPMAPALAAVFAVGATPAFEEVILAIREQNKLGALPFFYMEGGFAFEKLALPQRMLLTALKKSIAKKTERSRQEDFMAQALGASFDHSDRAQAQALIGYLRTL